jgi:hypothetical protein
MEPPREKKKTSGSNDDEPSKPELYRMQTGEPTTTICSTARSLDFGGLDPLKG